MKRLLATLVIITVLCLSVSVFAQPKKFKYVGVKKCKMCHKGVKKGKIFEKWQSFGHAKAYETLATDAAKKTAKEAGVKGDPQQAPECLVCHVTGYEAAADQKTATLTLEEGVSCEACHGPGSAYKSLKVKKAIKAGTAKAADYGLLTPDEKTCVKCHNKKSPNYKEFNFAEFYKKMEHHLPK